MQDNIARSQRAHKKISLEVLNQLEQDYEATNHDEGPFKPDFSEKEDEESLLEVWGKLHSGGMDISVRSVCWDTYKKAHPMADMEDKEFSSFYNAISYQLKKEIQ